MAVACFLGGRLLAYCSKPDFMERAITHLYENLLTSDANVKNIEEIRRKRKAPRLISIPFTYGPHDHNSLGQLAQLQHWRSSHLSLITIRHLSLNTSCQFYSVNRP